jgi:hypothetical protein
LAANAFVIGRIRVPAWKMGTTQPSLEILNVPLCLEHGDRLSRKIESRFKNGMNIQEATSIELTGAETAARRQIMPASLAKGPQQPGREL